MQLDWLLPASMNLTAARAVRYHPRVESTPCDVSYAKTVLDAVLPYQSVRNLILNLDHIFFLMVEHATLRPLSLLGLACRNIRVAIACRHLKISILAVTSAVAFPQSTSSFALVDVACPHLFSIFEIAVLGSLLWLVTAPL
jgi:hypothetical protein